MIPMIGVRRGRSSPDQIFTLQQIFEKSWKYAKHVCRLQMFCRPPESILPGSAWNSLRNVAWIPCWRPPVTGLHIPVQNFVFVSAGMNHNRSPWVLDSDKSVYCHHSIVDIYMNWVESQRRVNENVIVGSCNINRLPLADYLVLLGFSQQGLQHALDRFPVACGQAGMTISTKKTGIMPLQDPKSVYAAREWQYTAKG